MSENLTIVEDSRLKEDKNRIKKSIMALLNEICCTDEFKDIEATEFKMIFNASTSWVIRRLHRNEMNIVRKLHDVDNEEIELLVDKIFEIRSRGKFEYEDLCHVLFFEN